MDRSIDYSISTHTVNRLTYPITGLGSQGKKKSEKSTRKKEKSCRRRLPHLKNTTRVSTTTTIVQRSLLGSILKNHTRTTVDRENGRRAGFILERNRPSYCGNYSIRCDRETARPATKAWPEKILPACHIDAYCLFSHQRTLQQRSTTTVHGHTCDSTASNVASARDCSTYIPRQRGRSEEEQRQQDHRIGSSPRVAPVRSDAGLDRGTWMGPDFLARGRRTTKGPAASKAIYCVDDTNVTTSLVLRVVLLKWPDVANRFRTRHYCTTIDMIHLYHYCSIRACIHVLSILL